MVFHVLLEQNCRVGKRQRHVLLRDVQVIFVIRLLCQLTLVSTLIAIAIHLIAKHKIIMLCCSFYFSSV